MADPHCTPAVPGPVLGQALLCGPRRSSPNPCLSVSSRASSDLPHFSHLPVPLHCSDHFSSRAFQGLTWVSLQGPPTKAAQFSSSTYLRSVPSSDKRETKSRGHQSCSPAVPCGIAHPPVSAKPWFLHFHRSKQDLASGFLVPEPRDHGCPCESQGFPSMGSVHICLSCLALLTLWPGDCGWPWILSTAQAWLCSLNDSAAPLHRSPSAHLG